MARILEVRKRDSSIRQFNAEKITMAVNEAMSASNEGSLDNAGDIMRKVVEVVENIKSRDKKIHPVYRTAYRMW